MLIWDSGNFKQVVYLLARVLLKIGEEETEERFLRREKEVEFKVQERSRSQYSVFMVCGY